MGANLPAPHRCFNMRNPFARAMVLALAVLFIGAMMLRSEDIDVKTAIIKTAQSAKQSVMSQRPLDGFHVGEGTVTSPSDESDEVDEKGDAKDNERPLGTINSSSSLDCGYDMDRLKKLQLVYDLDTRFEYAKRHLKISRQNIPRKSMTKLSQNLIVDKSQIVDLSRKYSPETCPEPLEVPVTQSPFPADANASDFIFGVSTTYSRFINPQTSSLNEWTYWLTDGRGQSNGGKLVLMLLGAKDAELEDAYDTLVSAGIDVDVYQSDPSLEMAVRYLNLVPTLYMHPERQGRKWLVICDDDTFFPSFNALAERLEDYDHTQPMYIGTFSEDVNNIQRHGSQAFGGAGVFVSSSLAKIVTEKYESCKTLQKIKESDSGWGPQGDILLRKCIYENSETRLTLLNDLWQLDFYDDPAGFYESGMKPLSVHHYRGGTWHVAYPWHGSKVSQICGEDCYMQRFQTLDNFVISNGYSVAYYPKGVDFNHHQIERTFKVFPDDKGWNMDYKMGPQRASLHRTGRKIAWELKEATVNKDGSVSQYYIRRADDARWKYSDGQAMSRMDGVIELVWMQ